MKKTALLVLIFLTALYGESFPQWSPTGGPNAQIIYGLHKSGSNLFAAAYGGVYLTTDGGETWVLKNNGMGTSSRKIYALAEINNKLIAGTDSGMFVSTDFGELWVSKNSGLPVIETGFIHELINYNSTALFAGTEGGVFISTDYGESWTARNTGLTNLHIYSFTIKQNKLFAGSDSRVFVTSNGGLSWNQTGAGIPNGFTCDALGTDGNNTYAGLCCGGGLYVSTNEGAAWQKITGMPSVNTFLYLENKMLSGSADGVMYSVNGGFSWTPFNNGLQYLNTTAFAYDTETLYAGVENIVWRRPMEQLLGVKPAASETPQNFVLYQNYPNPFNPETIISYELQITSRVVLSVYNIEGKRIIDLVNQEQNAGKYEVKFNADNFSSGIYFYRIETQDFSQTRKMILIK